MQNNTDSDSRSPPTSRSTTTRAESGLGNKTAPCGFGAVIEKEHDLQTATKGSFGQVSGHHSAKLDRILHHQHSRLGANIALLEQRYEALPNPERFVNWNDRSRPPASPRRTHDGEAELLPDLIAQHTQLLGDIEALIDCAPDGQRGELILTEVSRNHEEMAWMLAAILREDETVAGFAADGGNRATASTRQAQENWDNEGGPVRV